MFPFFKFSWNIWCFIVSKIVGSLVVIVGDNVSHIGVCVVILNVGDTAWIFDELFVGIFGPHLV